MRKKQLILQNSSLFAEIERKAGEIESQHIKIEDLNEVIEQLNKQNRLLNEQLAELEQQNQNLKAENQRLLSDLENAQTDEAQDAIIQEVPVNAKETKAESDYDTIVVETESEQTDATKEPDIEISHEIPKDNAEKEKTVKFSPPATQKSNPHVDILRAYGAEHIGKITRLTAKIISLAEDEATKNIALGKNEGFKLEILSLINQDGSVEDIKLKMDNLASQTAEYLDTIQNIK